MVISVLSLLTLVRNLNKIHIRTYGISLERIKPMHTQTIIIIII